MKYRSLFPLAIAIGVVLIVSYGLSFFYGILDLVGIWLCRANYVLALAFVAVAARNLRVLSEKRPRFGATMSVVWFLVPLVNVVMAHQVLTALWRESQRQEADDEPGRLDLSVAAVNVWWACVAANLFVPLLDPSPRGVSWQVRDALWLVAGLSFVVLFLGIARRQREQWRDLERRRAVPQPTADALR